MEFLCKGRRLRFHGAPVKPDQLTKLTATDRAQKKSFLRHLKSSGIDSDLAERVVKGTPGSRKSTQRRFARLDDQFRNIMRGRGDSEEEIERFFKNIYLCRHTPEEGQSPAFLSFRVSCLHAQFELMKEMH